MSDPDTPGAWQEHDDECAAEDVRRNAAIAVTEDQYLDALREAGSLGAGIATVGGPSLLKTLRDRMVLAQCYVRKTARHRQQAAAPADHSERAEHRHQQTVARLKAFRVLGNGPARSREWHDARGCYGPGPYDYEAAVRAELAARQERQTA